MSYLEIQDIVLVVRIRMFLADGLEKSYGPWTAIAGTIYYFIRNLLLGLGRRERVVVCGSWAFVVGSAEAKEGDFIC